MLFLDQRTEIGAGLEEESNHRDEQQGVAGVRDTDAPGIMVVSEYNPLHVAVVVRLTETEVVVLERLVHLHDAFVHVQRLDATIE